MNFSTAELRKYQEIYRRRYGKEISVEEARRQADKLLNLFKAVLEE